MSCLNGLCFPKEFSFLVKLESCKSIQHSKQIHALLLKLNPLQTHFIFTKIISFAASSPSSESLIYARSLLTQLENPDIYTYNVVIQGLSTSRNTSIEAIVLFRELLLKGIAPNHYTVPYVFKACAQSLRLKEGVEIHGYSIKTGLVLNVYVMNTLMRLYAVCGIMNSARKVFDGSAERDLVSWTTLIQGYVKSGFAGEGIDVFFELCESNLIPDQMTLVIVLSACSRLGDLSLGRKIHRYMVDNQVKCDVFVENALIDMYLKCGEAVLASKVFDEMRVRNVITWNSLISGLSQQGKFKEALDVFRKMQRAGVKPDDVTLVGVLNSCANLGVLELGKWVHSYFDKNRIKADGFIGNALVDMYGKCGSIKQALKVFEGMKCKDVYSYTAMIVGLAMHGEAERALEIFFEMPEAGIKPDEVTFVGVLTACSHVGLVDEGRRHFEDMLKVYNLKPQTEHYGCMVDLLGRAGLIREAEEFIQNMPIEPDAFVWGSLLGACKIHGRVELAESVMEKLVKLEPERDGAYILMSNIYSSANRWKDALKLRKTMKVRKMKKTPGCSSIELDGVVHEFKKGDKSHCGSKEIYMLLDQITSHMKSTGQNSFDIN